MVSKRAADSKLLMSEHTIVQRPAQGEASTFSRACCAASGSISTPTTSADVRCSAKRLLKPDVGTLQVVLPVSEEDAFLTACAPCGLFPSRRTQVVTRRSKPPRRVLLSLSTKSSYTQEDELLLSEDDGSRSEAYKTLTKSFYL